ncbi:MAG TPA: hypothetical protein VK995_02330 [Oceanipulchritudo sp.]|nr:hypothetical protein [Oceanipulchritudo sp.]
MVTRSYPLTRRAASKALRMLTILVIPGLPLLAYESYHDPNQNDLGYCSTCHPGFAGGRSDTLHALHTGGSDPVTTNCNLCHTGSSRDNPLTLWSTGDSDNGLGCMGCHGRDYGQSVSTDYRGFPTNGLAKNSGVGLRLHHKNNGIAQCAGCHTADPNPYPENVINPGLGNTVHYYFRSDVSLGGQPVDPSLNEDKANDADGEGLDNDGDNAYDGLDSDTVMTPGSVLIARLDSGGLRLRWPTPSPMWVLQTNALLDSNWIDMAALDYTQRINGYWYVDVNPPLDPRQFYRLNFGLPPPPAAAKSGGLAIGRAAPVR